MKSRNNQIQGVRVYHLQTSDTSGQAYASSQFLMAVEIKILEYFSHDQYCLCHKHGWQGLGPKFGLEA